MRFLRYVHFVAAVFASLCLTNTTLAADIYVPDKTHSLVGFAARHLVIYKVRGKFHEFEATIMYDANDITKSSMQGIIKAASLDTDHEKRDNHLRSEDFLYVDKYPEITFASKRVEQRDSSYVLIGDLTIRGVTKEVVVPFTVTGKIVDPSGKTRVGFEAALRINRQDFGVSYSKVMDNGGLVVSDTVDIELTAEAVQQGG
jgi:polyisoprenoid-binding protein YceI